VSLAKKLARWQAAGLLDAATAAKIAEHESKNARPYLLYSLGGLGALAIGIGFISLVASNWDEIPRAAKLGADLLILAGLAGAIYRAKTTGHRWVAETLIVLQYVLTLASIALVGQTYQLGGEVWHAMLFWTLITAPLMCMGESAFVAVAWVAGAYTSAGLWLEHWLDDWSIERSLKEIVVLAVVATLPLLNIALGTLEPLKRVRPAFAGAFWRLGWLAVVLLASAAQLGWYNSTDQGVSSGLHVAAPVLFVLAGATAWSLSRAPGWPSRLALRSAQALVTYAMVSSVVPFWLPHGGIDVFAALGFIALWAIIGFTAYHLGHLRYLNLATAVIAVRIIIGYVELFGSLATTGFGLIGGGLLTLGLTWLWIRKSKDFRAAAMAPGEKT
jgi:uncharacterized membrane protein